MNVLFFKISMLLLITTLSTVLFCVDIKYGYFEVFETSVTADDGETMILKQYEYMPDDPWDNRSTLVYLCDKDGVNLFGTFFFGNYLFAKNEGDYIITLKKVRDFNNVTLYDLTFTYTYIDYYSAIIPISPWQLSDEYHPQPPLPGATLKDVLKIWIDKEDGVSGGSIIYTPIELTTASFESYEYYTSIEDMLLYLVQEEFNNFEKSFQDIMPYEIDFYFNKILKSIVINAPETGKKLQKEFNTLKSQNIEVTQQFLRRENTKTLLTWYTSPIFILHEKLNDNRTRSEELLDVPDRPEVVGEYPVTEKELEAYKDWILIILNQKIIILNGVEQVLDTPLDDHWNPVKFELVDRGVKAISAGEDKEFGTDDDIVYINGVEQTKDIQYSPDMPFQFELINVGVKATSAGEDKEFGTDDDIVYIKGVEVK